MTKITGHKFNAFDSSTRGIVAAALDYLFILSVTLSDWLAYTSEVYVWALLIK